MRLQQREAIAPKHMLASNTGMLPLTSPHKLGSLTWGLWRWAANQGWLSTTTMASHRPHSKHIQVPFICKVKTKPQIPQGVSAKVYPSVTLNMDMERDAVKATV